MKLCSHGEQPDSLWRILQLRVLILPSDELVGHEQSSCTVGSTGVESGVGRVESSFSMTATEITAQAEAAVPLPRRGVFDRDWQKALVVQLTLIASVAVLWVAWQVVSPILHTVVLFALAAVLAFALSGPVDMLSI